ncbi:hypothetical protein HRED_10182, partial [Candidatus Haloredivivus sp. G17]
MVLINLEDRVSELEDRGFDDLLIKVENIESQVEDIEKSKDTEEFKDLKEQVNETSRSCFRLSNGFSTTSMISHSLNFFPKT